MAEVQTEATAPPAEASSRPRWIVRWLERGVWIYPVALVASFYGTWFTAWVVLGHQPRPSLDDPKYISALVDGPYLLTMVLMMCTPAAMLLGLVFAAPGATPRKRVAATFGLALVWVAVVAWLRLDPWDVGTWYMD